MPFLKLCCILLAGTSVFSLLQLDNPASAKCRGDSLHDSFSAAIIPQLRSLQAVQGKQLPIPQCWKVYAEPAALPALLEVMQGWGMQAQACSDAQQADIVLHIASPQPQAQLLECAQQAYRLDIDAGGVRISSPCYAGALHALASLYQLQRQYATQAALPACRISDRPQLAWRGMLIDSCRSFFSEQEIMGMLDIMALHKLNVLHWHLSDDQGWRIEIRKYPLLCEVAAKRSSSPRMGAREQSDLTPYGSYFYSQQQVRRLVDYAAKRGICIVPEIEMPGHASAALAAYPQFGNSDIAGYNPQVVCSWGVFPYTFAPGEHTFAFLADILQEVSALFPGQYLHIGGDEAPKDQWKASARAQAYMRQHDIRDEHALQSHFIARVQEILQKNGKIMLGWDEIEEGGLHPEAVVMFWRSWNKRGVERIMANGNKMVLATNSELYLDYAQHEPQQANLSAAQQAAYESIGQYLPLRRVHDLQLPQGYERQLLGVQAQCWSEYLFNYAKWQYQALPRLAAVAEVGWSGSQRRDYENFLQRLQRLYAIYDAWNINYCKPDGSTAKPQADIRRQPSEPKQN